MTKKFDAELGAVSPWIVVPGKWTESEMNHQAELVVACKLFNSSAICASPQLMITDRDWPQRKEFLDLVKKKFVDSIPQPIFYPGTADRCNRLKDSISGSEQIKKGDENTINPVFLIDIPMDSLPVKEEAFSPILGEITMDTKNDVAAFLKAAVTYCNIQVFGSLSCSIMIDPRTEHKNKESLEDAVANLEWGTIGINEWAGFAPGYGILPWGAYPKHTPEDIQSGVGKVGNAGMYVNAMKGVLRNQFVSKGHLQLPAAKDGKVFLRLAKYTVTPSWGSVFGLMGAALLGI